MQGIEIRPKHYMAAATPRFTSAQRLAKGDECDMAAATYCAGLAVECALKSFLPIGREMDRRHNLEALAQRGVFLRVDASQRERLVSLLTELKPLWKNSLRYYSPERFEAFSRHLVGQWSEKSVKGSHAGYLVRIVLSTTEAILKECKKAWQS